MGIPWYFYTVYKKYNTENDLTVDETTISKSDIDYLFLDYNSMIHPCAQQVLQNLLYTDDVNYIEDEKTKEKVLNPNLEKYSQEINPILQEEKELEIPEIKIGDFQDTKVEGYYPVFFSKVVVE